MKLVMHPEISKWRDQKLVNMKLFEDMRERGQLQNMVARKLPNGDVELLAGYQRHLALKALGKKPEDMDIKILENVSDEEAILIAFSENDTRTDLTTIEEARVYASLANIKLTQKQIGEKTGNSETYVRDRLHLLELPKDVQALINDGAVPVSYAPTIRKLDGMPKAQMALAHKICSKQWDRINTIEKAEEVVEKTLADVKRKAELLAKYGPCPACGSGNIDREPYSYKKEKMICGDCRHQYHAETRDPWKVYELKQDAEKLGLKPKITENGKVELTPKAITEIVKERTTAIAAIEKPNPAFRSTHTLGEMLKPLLDGDNIQTLQVDGEQVTVKLIKETDLHFKAIRKTYSTGEKSRVTVTEGWNENDKVQHRMPNVKKFMETLN